MNLPQRSARLWRKKEDEVRQHMAQRGARERGKILRVPDVGFHFGPMFVLRVLPLPSTSARDHAGAEIGSNEARVRR